MSTPQDDASEETVSDEEVDEVLQEIERKRSLTGLGAIAVAILGIAFSFYQMWLAAKGFVLSLDLPVLGTITFAELQLLQINAVHVAFGLVLAFMLYPPSTGDGRLFERLDRATASSSRRFGEDHPATRALDALDGGLRWLLVDPDFDRITPLDIVLMVFSAATAAYFITDFAEIQRMRALGLESGDPIQQTLLFGFLEPVAGLLGPITDVSYALLLGVIGVVLVLEATRRAISTYLMLIVAAFIVYARFGFLIPTNAAYVGVLSIPPLDWGSIIQNLWYNTENGVFGIPITVSVQFIYIFILFGAFLEMSGAGRWFIDLAYAATGTRRGGPAKASILASGFMGTISGSSIANTVTTGAFTIPLMKKSGYRPEFAGGVEASASSGGQILPPVMGAAAFLIVQYTATPFREVIIVATIPAIVFFFGVWVMVHFEAVKEDIGGLNPDDLVDVRTHMKKGWFYLVPIGLLLYYLLIERLSVARSAWFTLIAIGALITLVAAYSPETRGRLAAIFGGLFAANFLGQYLAGANVIGAIAGGGTGPQSLGAAFAATIGGFGGIAIVSGVLTLATHAYLDAPLLEFDPEVDRAAERTSGAIGRDDLADNGLYRLGIFLGKSMEGGARTAVPVVIAVAAAGIIPGVISVSGLGPNLVSLITAIAANSLVLLLLLTAFASILLGMGMPTTVTYIILVSLLAPAMTAFGVPLLAAHLYILYFGVIADITPPVAVAAYAASGVAKSDAFQTGIEAFSLSLNKAIVPMAFVLAPGIILLRGTGSGDGIAADQAYRVVTLADLADPSFLVLDVLIPVAGVFIGVIALAATVIGHVSSPVSRLERAAFAGSSLLLMAPGLLVLGVFDITGLLGLGTGTMTQTLDIGLRAVGLAAFVALVTKNRRAAGPATEPSTATESA